MSDEPDLVREHPEAFPALAGLGDGDPARSPGRPGVLKTHCLSCLSEWETDMVQRIDGAWIAADPEDGNLTVCPDQTCAGSLMMPERIETEALPQMASRADAQGRGPTGSSRADAERPFPKTLGSASGPEPARRTGYDDTGRTITVCNASSHIWDEGDEGAVYCATCGGYACDHCAGRGYLHGAGCFKCSKLGVVMWWEPEGRFIDGYNWAEASRAREGEQP